MRRRSRGNTGRSRDQPVGSRGLDMFQSRGEGREMDRGSARGDQTAAGPMELIGREPEIQQLRLFISRLTQGAGEALLLSGDPGVGKTSLLDQAAGIAAGSGIRLLRATGAQFEADISFAALHQLLRPCFTELPHLSPLHARALNVALGLGEGPPPAQLLVASAVLALLQQVAEEQPLLLIVDDLPWLDRASALVLGMVARRLAGLPVALLAAGRTGQPSFFDQGNLPVARVEPLSEEAAAELLTSRYPVMTPRVRRRLLDAALGNPLALLELPVSLSDLARTVAGTLGRWDEAQQLIDEGLQLCDIHGYHLLTWPGRLTAALLSAARVAAARDCRLDRLSPRLRLVVLGCQAITEPRTDTDPQTALEQAITEPGHDRWPFDLARIQLTYGSHLRRIKRTTDSRRQLAAAAETFRRLGAAPWTARADRELRATGVAVSTADTGLASLTPQQRQIALLAAAGHTNKQIAARLFLSPRTVSTHLHQVFPKLGITSRAALRDALADTSPE
jgi:DNA-binding CsgD family transcriptional regulator